VSQRFKDFIRGRSHADIVRISEAAITRLQYRIELVLMMAVVSIAFFVLFWFCVSLLNRFGLAGPMGLIGLILGLITVWLWLKVLVRLGFVVGQRAIVREAARHDHAAGP
jgi:hypothetical protein